MTETSVDVDGEHRADPDLALLDHPS